MTFIPWWAHRQLKPCVHMWASVHILPPAALSIGFNQAAPPIGTYRYCRKCGEYPAPKPRPETERVQPRYYNAYLGADYTRESLYDDAHAGVRQTVAKTIQELIEKQIAEMFRKI